MATNGRFDLGLRVLVLLAQQPDAMHTSATIAEELGESAVMVRRMFLQLHEGGFIVQRKGPSGGARLKLNPKEIGIGDVFASTAGDWLIVKDKALESLIRRVQDDAVKALNETTLAQVVKRKKKG